MKRFVKRAICIICLICFILVAEICSGIIIFGYLKHNLPQERLDKLFSKGNFFHCEGSIFRSDTNLKYDLYELTHLKANADQNINADGYRGELVSIEKPPNTIRILCLGDSTTFGIGVSLEHSYPYLLQDKLRRRYPDRNIEVINGGVPATHSIDAKRRFQVKFKQYKPDIVLWREEFVLTDSFELPEITVWDHVALWIKKILARSNLVNLIVLPFIEPGTYFEYRRKHIQVPEGVNSDYDSVKLLAKDIGAHVMAIDYVKKEEKSNNLISTSPVDREDIVRTLPAFIEFRYDVKSLFFDHVHFTEKGNEILAEAVCNYLIKEGLLDR